MKLHFLKSKDAQLCCDMTIDQQCRAACLVAYSTTATSASGAGQSPVSLNQIK